MTPDNLLNLLPVALAFVLALILTPAVRALTLRWGFVARPKNDRWHKKPTALLGGTAILLAVVIAWAIFVHQTTKTNVVMAASCFLWLVGLVDDLFHLKPYQKLIGQVVGAAVVIASGLILPWTPWPMINVAVTVFWLIGITNAINLLDNMDGLAAGVAAIASACLVICFLGDGQTAEAVLLALFTAALLGFLVWNSNPASIFMGDCGSQFIGFFLASAALLHVSGGRSRSLLAVLAVPVLILFIPIFDTTFVTVMRKLSGRAVSQGGRDHTSHRMVGLGMSERRAVWMLYAFSALSGGLALLVRTIPADLSLAAIAGFTTLLALFSVHLAGVHVYDEADADSAQTRRPLTAFLLDLSYKRRLFEVLLDVVLILLAYHAACRLLLGPETDGESWAELLRALPVLLVVKMATFLAVGVYRGLWRYVSIDGLIVYVRAVLLSSIAGALVVRFVLGFSATSVSLFILDGLILLTLLGGSRIAFRLFRRLLPATHADGKRRVLIFGAGDGGELLLREMRNNPRMRCVPVGFADDDPRKVGKRLHGLYVHEGDELERVCRSQSVEVVYLSTSRISEERVRELVSACREAGIEVRRMVLMFEPVGEVVEPIAEASSLS